MRKKAQYNVAVVGAGAVGVEMLRVLREHDFPVGDLRVLARSRRVMTVDDRQYQVEEIKPAAFENIDFALFAGTEGEKGAAVTYAPEAVKRGAVVIDNGADFRMDRSVPLVVPEVNGAAAKKHKGIIANPNCSTIQMVVALAPIHRIAGVKRIIAATYQAASGAGRGALQQLWDETARLHAQSDVHTAAQRPRDVKNVAAGAAFAHQIGFNLFPQIGGFADEDYTSEEWKMVHETHKILGSKKIKISVTCVRVPVLNAHSEAVYVETADEITVAAAREVLAQSPGIVLMDEPANGVYPMPAQVSGTDPVYVGRIRRDPFVKKGMWLWVVSDNLRKGAATNAVQIAEYLIGAA
ncbi:MAG: aspartate-semialdehyde dehydrogenase [Candidatus Omnitrophica bacterium]|nr:aspartate-semialdehyde dehydrogenase [Candidatus Omnitrophota bacterium]